MRSFSCTAAVPTSTTSFRCSTRSIPSGACTAIHRAHRSRCHRAARTGTSCRGSATPIRRRSPRDTARSTEWFDALPFPAGEIVLGGFSQGAVLSYALGLGQGRPRPRALIALSGFIPTVAGWEPDLASPFPPIAIAHGTYDPVIPVEFGRAARDVLEGAGADVWYRESPMDHSIDPQVIRDLRPLVAPAA